MAELKAIPVGEAKKLELGTWIGVMEGDIDDTVRIINGIVVENNKEGKQVTILSLEEKNNYGADYDQIFEVGYNVCKEDSGLQGISYDPEDEEDYEEEDYEEEE